MTTDVSAGQTDRGRAAEKPSDIPAKGWKDIGARVKDSLRDDQVPLMSAGVAFFTLLALAPALAAIVSIYGLVTSQGEAARQIGEYTRALPADARSLIAGQVKSVAAGSAGGLGLALVAGVLLSLWTASAGMKQLIEAINIAYDEPETRKFLKLRGLALILTVGLIVGIVVVLGVLAALPAILSHSGVGSGAETVVNILRFPLLAGLMVVGLAVLYRYAPDRDDPRYRWVSWGAVIATILWIVGSVLFTIYVANFAHYNKTYGSLGAVVVLLLWLYLTAFVVILGAEINAEMERQTGKDTTEGTQLPMGRREAYAADSVGPTAAEMKAGRKRDKAPGGAKR